MPTERRLATLLAFARAFEAIAMDDALDLLDMFISDLLREASHTGEHERLRTLRDLDTAALQLWATLQVLLDERVDTTALRRTTFAQVPRERLLEAGTQVETLTRPPDDHYYPELIERYASVRRFLPTLLRPVTFHGTPAGQPMLKAWIFLRHLEPQRHPDMQPAPWTSSRVRGAGWSSPRRRLRPIGARIRSVSWNACKIISVVAMCLSPRVPGGAIHASSCCKGIGGKPSAPRFVGL